MAKLEELRRLKAMSQMDLAMAAGVSISTIYKLEHGRTMRVRPRNARVVAEALGVEPAEIEELRPTLGLGELSPNPGGALGKAKAALPVKLAPPSLPTSWVQHGAGAAL